MQQIDSIMHTKLLPALLGNRSLSQDEQQLLSLLTQLKGIHIPIFSEICGEENASSNTVYKELSTNVILLNSASVLEHISAPPIIGVLLVNEKHGTSRSWTT